MSTSDTLSKHIFSIRNIHSHQLTLKLISMIVNFIGTKFWRQESRIFSASTSPAGSPVSCVIMFKILEFYCTEDLNWHHLQIFHINFSITILISNLIQPSSGVCGIFKIGICCLFVFLGICCLSIKGFLPFRCEVGRVTSYSLSPGFWQSFVTIRSCNCFVRIVSTYVGNFKEK